MTTVRGMRMALTSTLLPQNPAFTWLSRLFDFRNAGDRGFKPRANTTLLMVSSAAARTPVVDEARSARFNQLMLPQLDAAYNFARYLSRDSDAAHSPCRWHSHQDEWQQPSRDNEEPE